VPEAGTLRLLPPLTVDSAQIERAVGAISDALLSYAAQ
jgi:4-aminobutyrate aminotransferase-like enzyme